MSALLGAPTTCKDWLEWAVLKGYEWAGAAHDQIDEDFASGEIISVQDAIHNFAEWEETNEGGSYWDGIYNNESKDVIDWRPPRRAPAKKKMAKKKAPAGRWRTKQPTHVKDWMRWARDAGYEWGQSGVDQYNPDVGGSTCDTIYDATNYFNTWTSTKEGSDYWQKIHEAMEGIQWRSLMVEPDVEPLPIGCLTFDEFIDATVTNYLLEFARAWASDNAQLRMFTPPEKGFTFELRDKCMLRALNALNDAEFEAEVVSVEPDGCYIARKRRAA
jgi:hypothetical protein